jgi:heme-degrading monooxygenase HmoA
MKGAGTPWAQEFPPAGVVRGFKEWRRDFLHLETRARSPICMQPIENQDKPSLVILFRSKLTSQAGEDYQAMNAEMETLVRQNPGFVDVKSYTAADGERLTVVWWRDEESLAEWRNQMRHREAQNTGRQKWYEYYDMDVATIVRSRSFVRK